MTPLPLPPYKYLKDRSISDETYSDYAQGWDDCLHAVVDLLEAHDIDFETRPATAEDFEDQQ